MKMVTKCQGMSPHCINPTLADFSQQFSWPADLTLLEKCKVVYHEMEGWNKPTTAAKSYYDLPRLAREYVEYIEVCIQYSTAMGEEWWN
jgi:adenylosuccinate synthase